MPIAAIILTTSKLVSRILGFKILKIDVKKTAILTVMITVMLMRAPTDSFEKN